MNDSQKDTAIKSLVIENIRFNSSSLHFDRVEKDRGEIINWLKVGFNCDHVSLGKQIQSLWSGYGEIVKFSLMNNISEPHSDLSVIVKWVKLPDSIDHPRGWQSDLAHRRKLTSYQVEMNVYHMLNRVTKLPDWLDSIRVPHCFHGYYDEANQQQVLVLEDLDMSGFPLRYLALTPIQTQPCIQWLARFHAYFLQDTHEREELPQHLESKLPLDNSRSYAQGLSKPLGLWPIGSYWHLATRPDEWRAMPESKLKSKAAQLDEALNSLRFQTLIHGDAKVANFCFSKQSNEQEVEVAALDFQYTGKGCGMKDFVYFLGSCLTEVECDSHWENLLDLYFASLKEMLERLNSQIDREALECEWRFAFELAWADFQRFLEGWSPDHKKNTAFSRALTANALNKLDI